MMVINKFYNCVATRSPDNKGDANVNKSTEICPSIDIVASFRYFIPPSLQKNVCHVKLIVVIVLCQIDFCYYFVARVGISR